MSTKYPSTYYHLLYQSSMGRIIDIMETTPHPAYWTETSVPYMYTRNMCYLCYTLEGFKSQIWDQFSHGFNTMGNVLANKADKSEIFYSKANKVRWYVLDRAIRTGTMPTLEEFARLVDSILQD